LRIGELMWRIQTRIARSKKGKKFGTKLKRVVKKMKRKIKMESATPRMMPTYAYGFGGLITSPQQYGDPGQLFGTGQISAFAIPIVCLPPLFPSIARLSIPTKSRNAAITTMPIIFNILEACSIISPESFFLIKI
jgi:hypothetical protein